MERGDRSPQAGLSKHDEFPRLPPTGRNKIIKRLIFLLLLLSGCDREIPGPEIYDLTYTYRGSVDEFGLWTTGFEQTANTLCPYGWDRLGENTHRREANVQVVWNVRCRQLLTRSD